MRYITLSTIALGFASLTIGQLETTLTSVNCINPAFCTTGTPTRSNGYTAPTTDSDDLTRTVDEQRRQLFSSSACTTITSKDYDYPIPISTHIECGNRHVEHPCSTSYECGCHSTASTWKPNPGSHFCFPVATSTQPYATTSPLTITEYRRQETPSSTCTSITGDRIDVTEWPSPIATHIQCSPDKATSTCSTSYECGCHSTHFTQDAHPETHLCRPENTMTISYPDYGGGRTQPGRGVARAAKQTTAPKQTWTRTSSQPIAARATSQDLGGRSQRRVAMEAEPTAAIAPCEPGKFGPGCFPIITHPAGNAIEARLATPTPCPPGRTGIDCHMCIPGRMEPGCPPSPRPPANEAITAAAALEARQEPIPTATTSSGPRCPENSCGIPGCRWGHECRKYPSYTHSKSNAAVTLVPLEARQKHDELDDCIGTECPIEIVTSILSPDTTAAPWPCPQGTCGPTCGPGPYCNKLNGRVASQDLGGRSQRRVAREAEKTSSPSPTPTTSHFGCPGGVCGPGCRWGHECDEKFGRGATQDLGGRSQRGVKREAEATAVPEVVHSTLLTLRA